jgi:hypothetical protein
LVVDDLICKWHIICFWKALTELYAWQPKGIEDLTASDNKKTVVGD